MKSEVQYVSINEMQTTVQNYIKAKKGVDIRIDIESPSKNGIRSIEWFKRQFILLSEAYSIALHHFKTNP